MAKVYRQYLLGCQFFRPLLLHVRVKQNNKLKLYQTIAVIFYTVNELIYHITKRLVQLLLVLMQTTGQKELPEAGSCKFINLITIVTDLVVDE